MAELKYGIIEPSDDIKLNKQEYHYGKTEVLLQEAEDEITLYGKDADIENLEFANVLIAKAQVHATLATIINKESME